MAKKDPAFLMYSNDWLEGTADLSPSEKGVYIDLLCYQHQKGNLPNDLIKLSRLSRLALDDFKLIWENIKDKFEQIDNRLVNQKLYEVMNERSIKGKKNTITGIFASLLRKANLKKKDYNFIKNQFKIEDFEQIEKERLTECLTEWFDKCLKSIEDENEDETKDEDIIQYYKEFDHLKITKEENQKLVDFGYTQTMIDSIYLKIENYKKNKNYKSLYLTSLDWLKREYPDINHSLNQNDLSNSKNKMVY